MKLKNIAVASALVAGSIFAVNVSAATYYNGTGNSYTWTTSTNNYLSTSSVVPASNSMSWFKFSFITPSTITAGSLELKLKLAGTVQNWSSNNISGSAGGTVVIVANPGVNFDAFTFITSSGTLTVTDIMLCNHPTGCGSSSGSVTVNLAPNAYALRSVYNIQSAALNAGLSYDCNVFDKEGVCLSTGGRYSTTNSPSASSTSGLLIGSYKYDKNIRLGAWVDQNLSTNNADGIKLGNSKPLLGVFGVWAERNDGLGYEVKVSAGYGEKDLTVIRSTSNEGSAKVNTKGIQSVSSYGIAIGGDWTAAPYVGVKYVSVSRGGYTEGGSSALTYDTLRQETTSALAGVKFTGKIDPQTFAVLSAGVEHDLNHNVGRYSAGSSNTTAFNSDVKKTRPVVSAGVYHDLDKTQRLGLNAVVRQEPFQSTSSTSAMATYTVGF